MVLVADLRWIFQRQPGIAAIEDKTLKLSDLQAMNSIEDAKRYMLESRVLEVLRGGFTEWLTYFEGRLGLSMGYLTNEKGRLIEVFQRRNLFVHNGGYVGESYRKFVPEELQEKPPEHARVSVTRPYLEAAIDVFERCFILLAAELWKKQKIDDDARGHLLLEIAYDRLGSEAYAVAESLSRFAMNDKRLPERIRLSSSFNYWQSLKWQGRFEEVRPEVENLDMSAKDQVFAVARYALLDDEEAFFDALPNVLDRGLSEEDLESGRYSRKCGSWHGSRSSPRGTPCRRRPPTCLPSLPKKSMLGSSTTACMRLRHVPILATPAPNDPQSRYPGVRTIANGPPLPREVEGPRAAAIEAKGWRW